MLRTSWSDAANLQYWAGMLEVLVSRLETLPCVCTKLVSCTICLSSKMKEWRRFEFQLEFIRESGFYENKKVQPIEAWRLFLKVHKSRKWETLENMIRIHAAPSSLLGRQNIWMTNFDLFLRKNCHVTLSTFFSARKSRSIGNLLLKNKLIHSQFTWWAVYMHTSTEHLGIVQTRDSFTLFYGKQFNSPFNLLQARSIICIYTILCTYIWTSLHYE